MHHRPVSLEHALRRSGRRGCASSSLPNPYGSTIWPACRWPARIRSQRPAGTGVEGAREMAEQDAQVGRRLGERAAALLEPRARIDPGELDAPATLLDGDRRVEQHRAVLEPAELDRPRERVARDRVVVVAEHDVGMRQAARGARAAAAPRRGRESRSPVTQTRSGCRSATQSTARSTARTPRDGTPRWKSERCAMRRPSSSGGSPAAAARGRAAAPSPPRTRRRQRASAANATSPAASQTARVRLRASRGPA